jgi:hypothetical protein
VVDCTKAEIKLFSRCTGTHVNLWLEKDESNLKHQGEKEEDYDKVVSVHKLHIRGLTVRLKFTCCSSWQLWLLGVS